MTEQEFISFMGPLAQADMVKSGVLASVTTAQAILESGYGSTELARNANNFFGMKCSLSGNTWPGSTWDGVSKYRKQTGEEDANGNAYTITADFRKYASAADSVADHSAYLLGAMNGSKQRYAGLKGEMDPAKAIGIIKAGGYATDTRYVNKVLSIISKYNLTKYDQAAKGGVSNLKINQNPNFGTHNTSPRSGEIEYIVIHYVGATGTAKNNIDYYNQRSTTQASADFYVGFEGEKWQYNPNPKARYCWAVGGGKQSSYGGSLYGVARNANSVSIEMCVRNKGKPVSFYAFEMLYWCGIREGELLALTAADFDFEKETVRINKSYQRLHGEDVITTPKTKKSNRIIKMPKFLCEEMQEYLQMLYGLKKKERIFTVTKSYLHHEMDRGAKAAGVKRIRIHDLRHSHISLLIDMGFSAVAIADRVGHESIDITYQYAHLFPSKQTEMADRLDDLGKGEFENVS